MTKIRNSKTGKFEQSCAEPTQARSFRLTNSQWQKLKRVAKHFNLSCKDMIVKWIDAAPDIKED